MRFTDGAGYLFVDNSLSGGEKKEADLIGCGHCELFVEKPQWIKAGGYRCHGCHKPLCLSCAKAPPQMKCFGTATDQLERALSDLHRREQNAKILGI